MSGKICVICGKRFMARMETQKVCGDECRAEKDRRDARERGKLREHREHPEAVCVICGKSFVPNSGKQKVCGYPCSLLADRARRNKRTIEEQAAWEKAQAAQEKPKPTQKPRKLSPLAQTVAEARAHGLSYGQYVAKHITPGRELHKAERAMKKEGNKAERAKAEARALELEHEIEVIRRTS